MIDGNEVPIPNSYVKNYVEDDSRQTGRRPMDEFDSGSHIDPRTGSDGYGSRDLLRDLIREGTDRLTEKDDRNDPFRGDGRGPTPIESADSPLKLNVQWIPHRSGLLVQEVYRNGLGEKIGIRDGDLIYTLNSERLNESRKFFAIRDRDRRISLKVKRKDGFGEVKTHVLPTIRLRNGRAVIDGRDNNPFGGSSGFDNSDVPDHVFTRFYGTWEFNTESGIGVMKFDKSNPGIAVDEPFYRPIKVRLTDEFGDASETSSGEWDIGYQTRTTLEDGRTVNKELIELTIDMREKGKATYQAKFNKDYSKIKLQLKAGSGLRELILRRR